MLMRAASRRAHAPGVQPGLRGVNPRTLRRDQSLGIALSLLMDGPASVVTTFAIHSQGGREQHDD